MKALWLALGISLPFGPSAAQTLQREFAVPLEPATVALGRFVAATATSAGGVAVGTTDQTILVFDSAGRILRRLGREGGGPGEFRRLLSLSTVADTLFAFDGIGRITAFYPNDSSHTIRINRSALGDTFLEPIALVGARVLYGEYLGAADTAGIARGQRLILVEATGVVVDSLGPLDSGAPAMRLEIPNGMAVLAQPFVDRDFLAIDGRSGSAVVVRPPQTRFNRTPSRLTVEALGDTASRFAVVSKSTELTDAGVRVWLDERSQQMVQRFPGGARAARRALQDALTRPLLQPFVREAVLGTDGVLWLLQSPFEAERDEWTVLGRRGESLGAVRLARGSRPVVVSARVVWVIAEREDGEQELVRYRFTGAAR